MKMDGEEFVRDGLIKAGFQWLNLGLDSFERGKSEIELTVVFCATSFEIFAKLLVFHKDWKMVFVEPGDAMLKDLVKGKAKTIGLDVAEKRLEGFWGIRCKTEFERLRKLSRHRNRLVHFFHPDLPNETNKANIASEIAQGWAGLMELLQKSEFAGLIDRNGDEYRHVETRLLSIGKYLDDREALIQSANSSENLDECDFCRRNTLLDDACLLCGASADSLSDWFESGGIRRADCPECGELESVHPLDRGGCRCANPECHAYFRWFGTCEWCGDPFAVNGEDPEEAGGTYLIGCRECSGYVGHVASKDG